MIIFSLLLTIICFIRYFIHINEYRMSLFPVAIIVALFFTSGIQWNHKNGLKDYFDNNLQSFSRILINCSFLIILSLYSFSRPLWSIVLLSINWLLLWVSLFLWNNSRIQSTKVSIIFLSTVYLWSSTYRSILTWERFTLIKLAGMLCSLIGAFRSSYIFLIPISQANKNQLIYESFIIYHYLFILLCIQLYGKNPFLWFIIVQIYISLVIFWIYYIKNISSWIHTPILDLDVEYILRWYRMNQIPAQEDQLHTRVSHPNIQKVIQSIPMYIYNSLSISSIAITVAFCITMFYYGNSYELAMSDFVYFLLNTVLYIIWFYYAKKIGISDNMWRFFGFIVTNICYYIVVANVFKQDTILILFRSFLRASLNNVAMNTMQDLKSYLWKSDYQYWLMSNFFWLLIIIYFFLTLSLDILVKVAFIIMIIWLWLLINKDNLKEMVERK